MHSMLSILFSGSDASCVAQQVPSLFAIPKELTQLLGGSPNTSTELIERVVDLSQKTNGYIVGCFVFAF